MSSLFKRASWTLQYADDRRTPPKKQFSLHTRSKRTAERLQAELDDLYQRGLFDPWTDDFRETLERVKRPDKPSISIEISEARWQFLEAKKTLSPHTVRMYELVTRLFLEYVGDRPLCDVTPRHVTNFLTTGELEYAQAKRSLTTLHTYLVNLKVFVRWCSEQGWMEPITSCVSLPRKPQKKPMAFTKGEVEALIENARTSHVKPLVVLGAYTGLRRSELSRLRWEHVDLDAGEILVAGQTKSGKERIVPISSVPMKTLHELPKREGYVLYIAVPNRPIHPDTLTHGFLKLRRDVLPDKEGYSLHSLRHTFCTWLAEAGTPAHVIQRLAGHADITTTMKYVHALSDGREHVERALD